DKLWGNEKGRDGNTTIKQSIQDLANKNHNKPYNLPEPPLPTRSELSHQSSPAAGSGTDPAPEGSNNLSAETARHYDQSISLNTFLNLCATKYMAKHYMLFILGHGLVVGDDVFLFDEHAATNSVTLFELGIALNDFKNKINKDSEFELVSF